MSNPPLNTTRQQLAQMAPNPRLLKALEDMLVQVNNVIPSSTDTVAFDASLGVSQSTQALSAIERIASALEMLATAPPIRHQQIPDDLVPIKQEIPAPQDNLSPPQQENSSPSVDKIDFATLAPKPAFVPGRLFYDKESRALAYYSETPGVTFDICKESIITVINASGSSLVPGELVYINGASGDWPTVNRAKADAELTSQTTIGMVTSPMTIGQIGEVCTSGIVHDLDTSAYAPGTTLYLSATVAGGLTSVAPLQPNYVVEVANVVKQNATVGNVYVRVDKKPWFPSIEIRDTAASVVLPTAPTVFKPPTIVRQDGFIYDSGTGILTFTRSASYSAVLLFNAQPSAANKNIYFYSEEDNGVGFVINRYSARALNLPNSTETQVIIATARYFAVGDKIRFNIWGDATVTLKTTDLPGTTPGTVTLPAFRFVIAG